MPLTFKFFSGILCFTTTLQLWLAQIMIFFVSRSRLNKVDVVLHQVWLWLSSLSSSSHSHQFTVVRVTWITRVTTTTISLLIFFEVILVYLFFSALNSLLIFFVRWVLTVRNLIVWFVTTHCYITATDVDTLIHCLIVVVYYVFNLLTFKLSPFYLFLILARFIIRLNLSVVYEIVFRVTTFFYWFEFRMYNLTHLVEVSITVLKSDFNNMSLQLKIVFLDLMELSVRYFRL